MARVRSTNPVGVTSRDVAPDSPIYARWLRAAVGDTALAHDLITGANSTTAIDHSGAPLGCPLRLPLAAQHIGRGLITTGIEEVFPILVVPIFIRSGETGVYELTVEASERDNDDEMTLELRDNTWAAIPVDEAIGIRSGFNVLFSQVTWKFGISAPGIYYLIVYRKCGDTGQLRSWRLDHVRSSAITNSGLFIDGSTLVGSPYEAPVSYNVANNVEFYDEEVTAYTTGLSAYVTSRLNRKLNALWEYVTGSRIPGNNAYKSSSIVNNNRVIWTNEALLQFPIAIAALGAGQGLASPGKTPSSSDMQSWIRYPTAHMGTAQTFCGLRLQLPDFRTSPSALKAHIIMQADSTGASLANWEFNVTTGAGSGTATAPSQFAGTRFWRATVTGIPFSPNVANNFDVTIRHTAGGAFSNHVFLLGVAVYFEP